MPQFKLGETVQIGPNGEKGKIIDITRPLGTYCIYKVHSMVTGHVTTAATHELVKGMPDENFQNLHNCFENQDLLAPNTPNQTLTLEELETIDLNELFTNNLATQALKVNQPNANNSKRFVDIGVTPSEFIKGKENKRTRGKTTGHIKLLTEFLTQKNESRNIENIPPMELNSYLSEFIICVRQTDGSEYEPCTLRNMLGSFDRHLKEHKYETTIVKGESFVETMTAFVSKGKDLKMKGKGSKPKAASTITDFEIQQLKTSGQLGNNTPSSLINTLWLNNSLHFGMRGGGSEHRQLMWGDVVHSYDTELRKEFLEFNERQTKTRTGVDLTNIRDQKPRMYATEKDDCPIKTYKAYADLRPATCSGPDSPFYLGCVTHTKTPGKGQQWFLNAPIGVNKLNNLMSTMAKNAGLPELEHGKRLTNTSIRKFLCQKLLTSNVPDSHAIHITGHKNMESLNNYRCLTNQQQCQISNILSNSLLNTSAVTVEKDDQPTIAVTVEEDDRPTIAVTVEEDDCPTINTSVVRSSAIATHTPSTYVSKTTMNSQKTSISRGSLPANPGLFQNANITGGTFNITINTNYNKRKHQDVTDSDEELLIASQQF